MTMRACTVVLVLVLAGRAAACAGSKFGSAYDGCLALSGSYVMHYKVEDGLLTVALEAPASESWLGWCACDGGVLGPAPRCAGLRVLAQQEQGAGCIRLACPNAACRCWQPSPPPPPGGSTRMVMIGQQHGSTAWVPPRSGPGRCLRAAHCHQSAALPLPAGGCPRWVL